MSAVIEKALATAQTFETVDEYRLHSAIKSMKGKRDSLLGVEEHSRTELDRKLGLLAREALRVERWNQLGLPMIDESVLSWRQDDHKRVPLPQLVLTSLSDPKNEFWTGGAYRGIDHDRWEATGSSIFPVLPDFIKDYYKDVLNGMHALGRRYGAEITLRSNYHGVIPEKTKQEIHASTFELNELFLLREVTKDDWSLGIKEVPKPPRARHVDPLVVGIRDATLWYVTKFDPTPIEDYVHDEFSLLAGGNLQLTSGD